MLHFRKITEVSSPIEEVAALHRNPEILKELTPPWAPVNFHRIDPQAEGSVVEMTLWLGMIPVFWRAKHLNVHPIIRIFGYSGNRAISKMETST